MGVIEGRTWLEIIPPVGCERHLSQESVGRIAVLVDGHPEIFPINYAIDDGGAIIFRTDRGTKLAAVVGHAEVAFEIDGLDEERHLGWSVLVVGRATAVQALDELTKLHDLPLEPWAAGEKPSYVRIAPTKVSGRQIHLARKGS